MVQEDNRRSNSEESSGISERTVRINRVSKVVKGGRHLTFSATVVVGDGEGRVGIGMGKAADVPDAIKKGTTYAQKNMVEIPVKGDTIAHDVEAKFGGTIVMLKPAPPGTGVIAGEAVRAVVELAGVKDVVTKVRRSTNPTNVVKATLKGLQMLKDPDEEIARRKAFVDKKKYESRTLEEISE